MMEASCPHSKEVANMRDRLRAVLEMKTYIRGGSTVNRSTQIPSPPVRLLTSSNAPRRVLDASERAPPTTGKLPTANLAVFKRVLSAL